MRRPSRLRGRRGTTRWIAAPVACAVLGCLLVGFAAEVVCEEPANGSADGLRMVFPPNRSVLLSGEFNLICTAKQDSLEADGEIVDWDAFKPPLGVARLMLYNGRSKIRIGKEQLEVFVASDAEKPGGPEGWQLCRNHPISRKKRCGACHETTEQAGLTGVGELKSYKACFECHESVEFELTHSHPLEPIEHCQMCHSLHGSSRKALLKAPAKKLCAECHDS